MGARPGLELDEPVIFERGAAGRNGMCIPDAGLKGEPAIPAHLLRTEPAALPEVAEYEVVRHFTRLSRMNYGVDTGFYPLGSCTMKHNPRICEDTAALEGFACIHPMTPSSMAQGALALMWELEQSLKEILGFSAVTLLPAAGAHGELTGLKVMRAALTARGNPRTKVLIPDTAHGTNPATSALTGYTVVKVKSNESGILDPAEVAAVMDGDTAGIMITNPNTLGLFERNIHQVAAIVHEKGGLVYGDGANLNAIMGKYRPACLGIDVMQLNLHKTFSTPHGGGGPGSGPVGVVESLVDFLPVPRVVRVEDGRFELREDFPLSIGRMRSFQGQFGVLVKALTYIRALGADGLARAAEMAVLNANYVRVKLQDKFNLPYPGVCMHEAVFSDRNQIKSEGKVSTMDMAKRLMDHGIHPMTVYFPLIVSGAMMIEPTETENMADLDEFIAVMERIADEAANNPEIVHSAPHLTSVRRPDEVSAARNPVLTWHAGNRQA
ncbi:MAG TPA: aminomethyl-transferring glycine dehydrogenase subunit GcvPB [Myxococcota bacterium]|nr:aminomethyl-transferring glycine dehydrogenase subunit GcvPB [Myxococcota bacterium]HOH76246.1 aminomethyl-transferring glycine dehydrogenase subunit GcvPB [Myxococcota bacterium]